MPKTKSPAPTNRSVQPFWVRRAPCMTFRLVVVSLRSPGQSPVLPFACCVGSLLSVRRCGRCSCWCHFRVHGACRARRAPPSPLWCRVLAGSSPRKQFPAAGFPRLQFCWFWFLLCCTLTLPAEATYAATINVQSSFRRTCCCHGNAAMANKAVRFLLECTEKGIQHAIRSVYKGVLYLSLETASFWKGSHIPI